MQNSRERKKKITGRRWYSDKDCSRRGKHEGEDQRKDLGFVDCPRKKKKKKKEAKQSKKKTLNHRSLDSTSNQPSLALTLCLEGGKKKKNRKEEGWLSGGWALAQGDERRASRFQGSNSSPLPPFNFEGCSKCGGISRGEEKGRGEGEDGSVATRVDPRPCVYTHSLFEPFGTECSMITLMDYSLV